MPNQQPDRQAYIGELFEAAVTADAESVQWVSSRLRQTVRTIGAERSETTLAQAFAVRFRRMHYHRRLQRMGVGLASGTGLGLGADSLFDLGWVDWINDLFNWVGRPLLLRLGDSLSAVAGWVA